MEAVINYLKTNHIKLTQPQIIELFNDREANADKIVKSQLALVMNLAQRYHHFNQSKMFDEVVSDCMDGLLKAVNYFDPTLGVDFTAFAFTSIKQSMFLYKDDNNIIRPSQRAKRGELREDEVYVTTTSYDSFVKEDGDTISFLEVYQSEIEKDEINYEELCRVIKEELKPHYADIVIASFGLCGYSDKLTYDEMGEMFGGISRQRIQQIRKKALEQLKDNPLFIDYLKEIVNK